MPNAVDRASYRNRGGLIQRLVSAYKALRYFSSGGGGEGRQAHRRVQALQRRRIGGGEQLHNSGLCVFPTHDAKSQGLHWR
jgi:hypothetical protein